jgi:Melibiase
LLEDVDGEASCVPAAKSSEDAMWTLQSPFWSLQSRQLLTITYCYAWQAIPEYTGQFGCGGQSSQARAFCVRSCGTWTAPEVEYIQESFTVADIARVEAEHQLVIHGIGLCQMIKVFLRPMATPDPQPVPSYLKEVWEGHVQRMRNGRAVKLNLASPAEQTVDHEDYIGPVLTFCLPTKKTDPPLLWKVWLPEIHEYPIAVKTLTVLDGLLHEQKRNLPKPTHIYINGYQSWSFAGSLIKGQIQPGSALPNMFSRAFNLGGSPPPVASTILADESYNVSCAPRFTIHYQSDFFTCITSDGRRAPIFSAERKFPYQQLDETGGPALILGWLSQDEQFGVITVDKELSRFQMHCSVDGQVLVAGATGAITTDWAYAQLVHPHSYDEEPMANFLHTVAAYSQTQPLLNGSLLTGWCSWYVFYENINAGLLRDNFNKLAEMRNHLPTNVSVVDDGYMTAWGDWDSLKSHEFPAPGLEVVSRDISSHGVRPGLWLAPFAADKHSKLADEHPDWVIRNDGGVAANSSHCGKFFYGLDATNPEVLVHVHETVRRAVQDWKFNVLKIDFLYAACLEGNGKYDLSMSRAQAMHLALKTIRDAAGPDVFLIGCGCPIASGIGYVDAMRISADTGPTWYPALPLPWWDNGTLPALRSMVRNSISRAPFGHRWWHNDPDCLMLGSHTSLTDDEVASAATVVAMTCGMLLLSDDLPSLSPSRVSIVSKIFPLTGVTATVLDLHSTNDGLPSLMRLWCTDKYNLFDSFDDDKAVNERGEFDHNARATYFARNASFYSSNDPAPPSERKRSCIHVTKGMGTWTVVSISNWSDRSTVVRVPPPALRPPPTTGWDSSNDHDMFASDETKGANGYHVFSFWSSKYSWLADHREDENDDSHHTVCKKLRPHETEVFHIKLVTPDLPQFIGKFSRLRCLHGVPNFLVLIVFSCFLFCIFHRFRFAFLMWLRSTHVPRPEEQRLHQTQYKISTGRVDFCLHTQGQCRKGSESNGQWGTRPVECRRQHSYSKRAQRKPSIGRPCDSRGRYSVQRRPTSRWTNQNRILIRQQKYILGRHSG